ncbi:hypothetical protein N836_00340 [Leptolyngbya sp. Heron Island J]|uniref:hypothetical protein n=1 Tax=Leptolyngbya sp. Heron Island J TaxID=1385935 RepID=UPI0003B980F2|nr:hypothetical protein [Leptolyngbya sp. Heron Island J]ESA37161.1 hypothetical protein N836_00340 [Leptolyngbya sp. Heron Island J]
MSLEKPPQKPDSGLIIRASIEVSRELTKDLISGLNPWLIPIGLALLTGSGIVLSPNFREPGQLEPPAQTEVKK